MDFKDKALAWIARRGETYVPPASMIDRISSRTGAPAHLIELLVLIEDKRFWRHPGFDIIAIFRATYMNLRRVGKRQGGSTIPEQLIKAEPAGPKRNYRERALRTLRAAWLSQRMSKEQVLTRYLMSVYMGRRAYGILAASRNYFGKHPSLLSTCESFFLAERIALPHRFRQQRVLNLLQRPAIGRVLGHSVSSLPSIYGCFFGQEAASDVSGVLSQRAA